MAKKYPGIKWFCDNCGAYLNHQVGFDDHHYVWKCTECGYKSSISIANIRNTEGNNDFESRGAIINL